MTPNALYTDLSAYYDLLCADIDYRAQSDCIRRLNQLFGNGGKTHLDLGCGTGPHVRHFLDFGYQSHGLDLNQAMLDLAQIRCPEAEFSLQNMSSFTADGPVDLITCFLYSIHYNAGISKLEECLQSVYKALQTGGVFCFNVVDRTKIDNKLFTQHSTQKGDELFTFKSTWAYSGQGEKKALKLRIERTSAGQTDCWNDEHAMVALSFTELTQLLTPYFDVHIFEHDYNRITPRNSDTGNAIFTCVKI